MKKFGDNSRPYPPEMRRQLWPLCCGAAIISGFKDVATKTCDELVAQIEDTIKNHTPDHQVYAHEEINPKLTFLTLNQGQTADKKLMEAVEKAGFVIFGTAKPRSSTQSFFVRDETKTFKLAA